MKRLTSCLFVVLVVSLVAIREVISLKHAKPSFNGGKHFPIRITRQSHYCKAFGQLTALHDSTPPECSNIAGATENEKMMSGESAAPPSLDTKTEKVEVKRRKSLQLCVDKKLMRDITALKAFHDIYGHFRVPYYYMIPIEGNANGCVNSRVRRKGNGTSVKTSAAISAEMKKGESDVETHQKDFAKSSIEYPKETHGLRLGRRVAQIRKGEIYTNVDQRHHLATIGLIMPLTLQSETILSDGQEEEHYSEKVLKNSIEEEERSCQLELHKQLSAKEHSREHSFLKILSALKAHDNLFGDMLVPRYFIVPSEEPWPDTVWGMQLGNRVRNIRAKTAYNKPHYHQILIDLGFCFSMKNEGIKFPRVFDPFESQ